MRGKISKLFLSSRAGVGYNITGRDAGHIANNALLTARRIHRVLIPHFFVNRDQIYLIMYWIVGTTALRLTVCCSHNLP